MTNSNAHSICFSIKYPSVSMTLQFLLASFIANLFFNSPLYSEEANEEIIFGMSTALSGPAADLGTQMKFGIELYLDKINQAKNIKGRKFKLIAYDDGYEPERTIPNMRRLIKEDRVHAIIGNVGTPTAIAAVPIANAEHTLLFGAFTGAGVLRRRPPDRYVINYRASYAEETASMIKHLIQDLKLDFSEIAFFTQRDGYGDAGYTGGLKALRKHGLKDELLIQHVRYTRNTLDVEGALAQLINAKIEPKAVIMVGAYAPCAKFIRLARTNGFNPLFLNVSFVGTDSLIRSLGDIGDGVIVTQVVPPLNGKYPIVEEYHNSLKESAAKHQPSFISLEGFIIAKIITSVIDDIKGEVTRENIVDALEATNELDVGLNFKISFTPDNHQASHTIWPTITKKGKAEQLIWSELNKLQGHSS